MSEFEIDKLFRRKLADKKVDPSNEAWEKLSVELKNTGSGKKWLYWSAAASVALILGMSVYFLNNSTTDSAVPMAINDDRLNEFESVPDNPAVGDKREDEVEHLQVGDQIAEKEEIKKENIAMSSSPKELAPKNSYKQSKETENAAPVHEKLPEEAQANIELAESENYENTEIKEVGNEPLDEELPLLAADLPESHEIEPEGFPEIKIIYKSSEKAREDKNTLRKVVALARDIKEADIGLGTLREAKNELLAFGLKKTKDN